eukprot:365048-Chlamydomonas_euryale.AAC.33
MRVWTHAHVWGNKPRAVVQTCVPPVLRPRATKKPPYFVHNLVPGGDSAVHVAATRSATFVIVADPSCT